ncbi:hypothetical protein SKTS_02900 [Sulfurimicrobium lacus]|uniref:MSHA biogenesis protein MshI n=1 Tax=Sulfurimicrobium lacus TaxID=2715678 RepID=A0A6F8V6X0_9PROT|nr:fimbrial assembly protein [Sulfurimicrobium lacus]BCB25404.1 hypothetical protein SKTS_02900 [Sulfurimicrobium lacus]
MSQQINLFNPDFRKKRELFTALMLLQALAVLLVVMGGVYAYQLRQTQQLNKQARDGVIQLEQERVHLLKVAAEYAPRAKSQVLEKRVTELELQLKGEEAVLEVLQGGSLGNTEGYSGYMRAFARQTVSGLWLTGFSIQGAGKDMAIGGRTLRPELVPAYILRLNQEAVTQGRVFSALEIQQPKEEPATKDKPAQTPNYLEFNLHSNTAEGAK